LVPTFMIDIEKRESLQPSKIRNTTFSAHSTLCTKWDTRILSIDNPMRAYQVSLHLGSDDQANLLYLVFHCLNNKIITDPDMAL